MSLLLANKNQRVFRQMRDSFSGIDGSQQATLDKLKDLYSKSGSNKTFADWVNDLKKSQNIKSDAPILDWLKSDSAKNILEKAQGLVDKYNENKHGDTTTTSQSTPTNTKNNTSSSDSNNSGEVTLFGFHPITFAFTATAVLIGGYFLGRHLINISSKNKTSKTT